MPRKNCLVKVSGDMFNDDVLMWIKDLSQEYFVVVCVGGGTQINKVFQETGLPVGKHCPLGRETHSFKERQLARDVLEMNQTEIQDRLAAMGVHVSVVIPVVDIGTILCHVNGDNFVLFAYLGFDILYIVTTPQRVREKEEFFKPYDTLHKIHVIGFKI